MINAMASSLYLIAEAAPQTIEAAQDQINILHTEGWDGIRVSDLVLEDAYARAALDRTRFTENGQINKLADTLRSQHLPFEDLRETREHARGRVDFIVGVRDSTALERVLSLEPDGIFLPHVAIANPRLVEQALASRRRTFVEISLSLPNEFQWIQEMFTGQPVTLMLNVQAFGTAPLWRKLLGLVALKRLGCPLGLGGFEDDIDLAIAGLSAGATVLEASLPSVLNLAGNDLNSASFETFAKTVREFQDMPEYLALTLGDPEQSDAMDGERLSLVAARHIRAGEVITLEMVAFKAPYRGLSPRMIDHISGCEALYDIPPDDPITFGNISV